MSTPATPQPAHTPGPWTIDPKWIGTINGPESSPGTIAGIARTGDEQAANARLIALAPETAHERDRLKALLVELIAVIDAGCPAGAGSNRKRAHYERRWDAAVALARAAIARSEGGGA